MHMNYGACMLDANYGTIKSAQSIQSLSRQLSSITKSSNESVSKFISRINKLVNELLAIGKSTSDIDIKLHITNGLSKSAEWNRHMDTIDQFDIDSDMTIDELTRLISIENKNNLFNNNNDNAYAVGKYNKKFNKFKNNKFTGSNNNINNMNNNNNNNNNRPSCSVWYI